MRRPLLDLHYYITVILRERRRVVLERKLGWYCSDPNAHSKHRGPAETKLKRTKPGEAPFMSALNTRSDLHDHGYCIITPLRSNTIACTYRHHNHNHNQSHLEPDPADSHIGSSRRIRARSSYESAAIEAKGCKLQQHQTPTHPRQQCIPSGAVPMRIA